MVEFIDIGNEEKVETSKVKLVCRQMEMQDGNRSAEYFQFLRYQKDREGKWEPKKDNKGRAMNYTVPLEMIAMFVDMVVKKAGLNEDREH